MDARSATVGGSRSRSSSNTVARLLLLAIAVLALSGERMERVSVLRGCCRVMLRHRLR